MGGPAGDVLGEPPRKRTKLLPDDVAALRRRVLDYKQLRLKNLRDR